MTFNQLTDKLLNDAICDWEFEEDIQEEPVWLNPKQIAFKTAKQKNKVFQGGRGGGKTSAEAGHLTDCVKEMPGSKGMIYGQDFSQLRTKELPEILLVWERWGITEWTPENPMGDYRLYKEPPKGWKRIHKYGDYKNVISFPDGSTIELISGKQFENVKGGSYDYGVLVEAINCDKDHFLNHVHAMVRGGEKKYKSHLYLSWGIFSNMGYTPETYWVSDLKEMPKEDWIYIEGTIWDNVEHFGRKAIEKLRDFYLRVAPLIWYVDYMNEKRVIVKNPFYKNLTTEHLYDDVNGIDRFFDPIHTNLAISCDFNEAFYSLSVWQNIGRGFYCLNGFHTEGNGIYTDHIHEFCEYYRHRYFNKVIEIYGDVSGWRTKDDNGKYLYQGIKEVIESYGFTVVFKVKKSDSNPEHFAKHQALNHFYAENNDALPFIRFNKSKAMDVYLSCANAMMKKGYKKNKDSEKLLKGKNRKRATDYSDTKDYYTIKKAHEIIKGGKKAMEVLYYKQ